MAPASTRHAYVTGGDLPPGEADRRLVRSSGGEVAAGIPVLFAHDRRRVVAPLSAADATAIVRRFGGHDASQPETERALRLLVWLHDRHWWLSCGCIDGVGSGEAVTAPRWFPVARQGIYFLSRRGSVGHADGCPMRAAVESRPLVAPPAGHRPLLPWTGGWLVVGAEARGTPDQEIVGGGASRAPTMGGVPALGRLLLSVLARLGYHRVEAGGVRAVPGFQPWPVDNPYRRLRELGAEPVVADLRWREIGCTYLPALADHLVRLGSVADRFPANVRPIGFFVGVVDRIDARTPRVHVLRWASTYRGSPSVVVHGPVRRFGPPDTPGPFWTLAVLARRPGERRFRAVCAYAHPALSRRILLPVDSDLERRTAGLLLQRLDVGGPAVAVEKPLFDEVDSHGDWCRPDFVVWLEGGQRVVVETMGRDADPGYLAAKSVTHPRMRDLPGVIALIEHHPQSADRGDLHAELDRALSRRSPAAERTPERVTL